MKVFIDILTPKQAMLFSRLSERLRMEGNQVFEVTRDYREVVQLLRMKGVEAKVVGRHGGGTFAGKLKASAERTLQLSTLMKKYEPHAAVSFSSPETARVAFGLNIPHICVNDSPHADAVARLTIPLSRLLLTPKMIPKTAWTRYGISSERIVQYNALDVWAWLKDFQPDEQVLMQCGLDRSKPIVAFRTEESFAAYLLGKTSRTTSIQALIEQLLKSPIEFQMVVMPRYETQASMLKQTLGKRILICESIIDSPSLLSFTSVFVGAGGTMTAEAALLGVPAFSCYPDNPFLIERYLIQKKLIIRETDVKSAADKILKTLNNWEAVKREQTRRARELTNGFEDPIEVIAATVANVV